MTSPITEAESVFAKLEKYVATNAHRVIAYAVTEGTALFSLAHVSASSLEHEIAVAAAAAVAALINKAKASHLLP